MIRRPFGLAGAACAVPPCAAAISAAIANPRPEPGTARPRPPIDPSASGTNPDFVLETLEPRFSYVGHWCMAASTFNDANDANGTRLLAEPCSPTDSRQLWNL